MSILAGITGQTLATANTNTARRGRVVCSARTLTHHNRRHHERQARHCTSRSYALHNLPATRSISFARVVPKLVTKLATAGAAAGGAVIAGVSYIQYQAGRTLTPPANEYRH